MTKLFNTLTIFATIVVILFTKNQSNASNGKPVFEKNKHATPEMMARYIETNGAEASDVFITDAYSLAEELAKVFNYQNQKFKFVNEAILVQDVPALLRSSKMTLVQGVWMGNERSSQVRSTGYDPTDKHFTPFNRGPYEGENVWMFKVSEDVQFYWYSDKCGNPLYDDYHQPKKVVYEPPRTDPEPEPNPQPKPKEEDIIYRYSPPPAEDNIIVINEGDNVTVINEAENYQQAPLNYGGGVSFTASAGLYLGTGGGYSGGGNCYQPRNYCSSGSGRGGSYGGGSSSNAVVNNYVDVYVNNDNQNNNNNTNHHQTQNSHQTQINHQTATHNSGQGTVNPPTQSGGGSVYQPNGPSNPNGGTGGGPVYGSNRPRTKIVQAERFQQVQAPQQRETRENRNVQSPNSQIVMSERPQQRVAPQQRSQQPRQDMSVRPANRQSPNGNGGGGGGNHRASGRN